MKKHFTLLEIGGDSPMIGTITNVENTTEGINEFKEKFIVAVCAHLCISEFNYDEITNLFDEDRIYLMIESEGMNYEIEIIETWIY